MPGYTGINCTSLCPYPQYGVDCQRSCNCNKDLCDVSTGCIGPTTGKQKQKQDIKEPEEIEYVSEMFMKNIHLFILNSHFWNVSN